MPALGAGNISGRGMLMSKTDQRTTKQMIKVKNNSTKQGSKLLGPSSVEMKKLSSANQKRIGYPVGKNPRHVIRQQLRASDREGRAVKRQEFKQEYIHHPRFQGQSFLEEQAISQEVAADYRFRTQTFKSPCKEGEVEHQGPVEFGQVLGSLSERALRFRMRHRGGNKVSGGGHRCRARLRPQEQPPKIQTLLAGVDEIRFPVKPDRPFHGSWWHWWHIRCWKKKRHRQLCLLVMFEAYLRPGEALQLRQEDLVMPTAHHPFNCLNLHPSERLETSKVGLSDESIALDSQTIPWLGLALRSQLTKNHKDFMFDLTYRDLRVVWERTLTSIGLKTSHAVSVSIEAFGSITRPIDQEQEPSGSEEAWEVVKRLFSQALRGTCKSGTGISEVAKAGAGERNSSAQTTASLGPKFFSAKGRGRFESLVCGNF